MRPYPVGRWQASRKTPKRRDMPDEAAAEDPLEAARDRLLNAALEHVPFDGRSLSAMTAAETDTPPSFVCLAFPRGPIDMLPRLHRNIDREMTEQVDRTPGEGA